MTENESYLHDYVSGGVGDSPDKTPYSESLEGSSNETARFIWPDSRMRKHCPVDDFIPEVDRLLDGHQFVVIEAETGAGKTIRLPQGMSLLHPDQSVCITQPRRNAARWNSKYMASEMGGRLGGHVGLRLSREEPLVSHQTRIIFQIDQSLINQIRNTGRIPEGLVIVDEAHERSVAIDILLALLKRQAQVSPDAKVLVTSATIDTKKFAAYFGEAPVLRIPGRRYPVRVEDPIRLTNYEHHSQGAARGAYEVLLRFRQSLGMASGVDPKPAPDPNVPASPRSLTIPTPDNDGDQTITEGTVLVFLPGKDDITSVMAAIKRSALELGLDEHVQVLGCHGETSPEEQDKVQQAVPPRTLRFVCGTEILRTGVTVPQTVGAIDSLQVKRKITDPRGVGHLQKIGISRAEADQGMGRAGRTQGGFYLPVSFRTEYENLNPYPQPAILREPLTNVALQIAAVGESLRTLDLIDRPNEQSINVAIKRLQQIGALDDDEIITPLGEKLLAFPLSPERGVVLMTAEKYGVLPEAIITTAIMEAEGVFDRARMPNHDLPGHIVISRELAQQIMAHAHKLHTYNDQQPPAWFMDTANYSQDQNSHMEVPDWLEQHDGRYSLNLHHECFPDRTQPKWLSELARRAWSNGSKSDFAGTVNAYREFKAEEHRLREVARTRGAPRNEVDTRIRIWAEAHGLNYKRLRRAENTMQEVRDELSGASLNRVASLAGQREFDADGLTKALISGHLDHIARRVSDRGSYTSPLAGVETFQIAKESTCTHSDLVFIGDLRKIPITRSRGGADHFLLATTAASIKTNWLKEVAPHLCRYEYGEDYAYDPTTDMVTQTERFYFTDINVENTPVPSRESAQSNVTLVKWVVNAMLSYYGMQGLHSQADSANDLFSILNENRARIAEYQALNTRAGEFVFPECNIREMNNWVTTRVGQATNAASITNLDALRLPEPDQELVALVKQDNPDTIAVGGVEYPLDYAESTNPRLILYDNEKVLWGGLPNDGLQLPGGREVEVTLHIPFNGYYTTFRGTNISELKERVRFKLDERKWTSWVSQGEKPEIVIPDITDETSSTPGIMEYEYDRSLTDDSPLTAFGTVQVSAQSYGDSPRSVFTVGWFRTRHEAESAHAGAEAKLLEIHEEINKNRDFERELAGAKQWQAKGNNLYERYKDSPALAVGLHRRLINWHESNVRTFDSMQTVKQVHDYIHQIQDLEHLVKEEESRQRDWLNSVLEVGEVKKTKAVLIPMLSEDYDMFSKEPVYGVPDDDGIWRLYTRKYLNPELEPEAWVLQPMKGYRSQSIGNTLGELVADYLRGSEMRHAREFALRNLTSSSRQLPRDEPILDSVPSADIQVTDDTAFVATAEAIHDYLGVENHELALTAQLVGRAVVREYGVDNLDGIYSELDALSQEGSESIERNFEDIIDLVWEDATLTNKLHLLSWREKASVIKGALVWIDSKHPQADEITEDGVEEPDRGGVTDDMLRRLQEKFKR